jgi:single-strand DNA-binding protein
MSGVNKVILVGNLGSDPQIRYTPQGTAVANFNIATTERFTNKNGEREARTEWHRIVAWGRLAEICSEYLKKGKQIYVEGRIQTRQWDDKDGNKRTSTEIVANNMVMLGRAGDVGDVAPPQEFQADAETTQETSAGQEDDLPF